MIKAEASTADYHTLANAHGKTRRTLKVSVDAEALGNVLLDYVKLQQFAGPEYQTREDDA